MFVQPIDYFLVVWFALALLSTAYVAWAQFKNNPEPVIMKWAFILVSLYMSCGYRRVERYNQVRRRRSIIGGERKS